MVFNIFFYFIFKLYKLSLEFVLYFTEFCSFHNYFAPYFVQFVLVLLVFFFKMEV